MIAWEEIERMGGEVVVFYFKYVSRNSEGTKGNHEQPQTVAAEIRREYFQNTVQKLCRMNKLASSITCVM
jgi:hypothetical protein